MSLMTGHEGKCQGCELELDRFCRTRKIKFFDLELEKKQSSSSSLIKCYNFIDSNLSKRILAYF